MGDIKRKQNKFSKPRQLFDRARIDEENKIVKKYGLKNKREIWKAEAEVSKYRRQAKSLIPKSDEEKQKLFEKLNKIGLNVKDTSDVLGLTKENWLERRLQTIVFKKKLANTVNQARQFIVHKKVLVDGNVVNKPGFIVNVELEKKISVKPKEIKEKKVEEAPAEKVEEIVEEEKNE
jgi:small subunit ribosomal protein S4